MILHHDKPSPDWPQQSVGTFNLGRARLLLDAGHGEYMLPKDIVANSWLVEEYEDNAERLPEEYRWYLDLDGWETVLLVEGDVHAIALGFYQLAMDLDPSMDPANYTPGGDDDTFDYWPSGMRLLHALALDLDRLTSNMTDPRRGAANPNGERYLERYRQIVFEALERYRQIAFEALRREVPELDVPLTEEVASWERVWRRKEVRA